MRKFALAILMPILLLSFTATAQDYSDVIRISRPDDLGSARFISMGGAFSALGNDIGAISMNPAGLAVYRHSEITFSTYYRATTTNTNYEGFQGSDYDGQLRFSQLGLVSHKNISNTSHFNFGLRYHRTNDYGFKHIAEGSNINSSVVDQWLILANFYAPNGESLADAGLLYEDMANDVGLIGYNNGQWNQYAGGAQVTQRQAYESSGGKGILGIDFAVQTDDTWNIGGSIEIPTLSYSTEEVYSESNYDASSSYDGLTWTNRYSLTGIGFQLKFGAIFTDKEIGRISAYVHTPTWWNLVQEGSSTLVGNYANSGGSTTSEQPFNAFNWQMTTPAKFGVGYAYVFEKNGLLSVDYAFQSMPFASVRSSEFPGSLDFINEDIADFVKPWHDIRIGGEMRFDQLFIRGGYHITTSPFTDDNQLASQYSGGVGFKDNRWGIDLAYSLRTRNNEFYFYAPELVNAVSRSEYGHFIVTTLYFRI
ncbi:MAG: hypothetical protein HWD92_12930 [Flavobacteriia bacterium]|nr:hypothetical protein [Flavobacteriia bacterium]